MKAPATNVSVLDDILARRIRLILVLFLIYVVGFSIVPNIPFLPGEAQTYQQVTTNLKTLLENTTAAQQVVAIFSNNIRVALESLIPGTGLVVYLLSIYDTGRGLEAIALFSNPPVPVALAIIAEFLVPSTWIELPAYSVATAEGLYIIYALYAAIRGEDRRLKREGYYLIATVGLVALILAVAAVFEVAAIQLGSLYALTTWLFFFPVMAGAIIAWRRARDRVREARVQQQEQTPSSS